MPLLLTTSFEKTYYRVYLHLLEAMALPLIITVLLTLLSQVNANQAKPTCQLGCNICGYNWYEKHYNKGNPTQHWDKYCNCCKGTMEQQNTCKAVCTTNNEGQCQLGCKKCGYNWYEKHYNNGSPTQHWNKYCNCCKGTMEQQNTCKAVCTNSEPTDSPTDSPTLPPTSAPTMQPTEDPTSNTIDDDALVKGVESTLGECSDIVQAVGDFLSILETSDENRRRDEKEDTLAVAVTKKMKTCGKLIEAVDTFRQKSFFPYSRGYIKLRWSEVRFLNQQLKLASKKMGETLFVASKDGDTASKFHAACDKKGPTIVIVETTTGNVFGGYTDLSWGTSSGAYVKSSNTFIFRLRPTTKRYDVKEGKEGYAIYTKTSYGPTFGGGHDFYIVSSALSSTSSYTNGGHSYVFPSYPNYQLNDGVKNFKVKDYAVVQVLDL